MYYEYIYKESILFFYNKCFKSKKEYLICKIARNHTYYRYLLYKNYCLLNLYKNKKGFLNKIIYYFKLFKYSKYSSKLNVMINTNVFIKNFWFEHFNVVINKEAIIGENLVCIGNNCIGGGKNGAPIIGDNVFVGYGAIIIGKVHIASNVKIGAGAIVTKDILEEGCTVIGTNKIIKKLR